MGGKMARIKHEFQIHDYTINIDMFYHMYSRSTQSCFSDKEMTKSDFISHINKLIKEGDLDWNLKQYLKILHSPRGDDDFVTIRGFIETVILSKLNVSSCHINKLTIKDKSEIRNEKIKLLIK